MEEPRSLMGMVRVKANVMDHPDEAGMASRRCRDRTRFWSLIVAGRLLKHESVYYKYVATHKIQVLITVPTSNLMPTTDCTVAATTKSAVMAADAPAAGAELGIATSSLSPLSLLFLTVLPPGFAARLSQK